MITESNGTLTARVIGSITEYLFAPENPGAAIEDEMKEILHEKALNSHHDPLSFLRIETIFGDLINSKRFTKAYVNALQCLYHKGVIACLKG